MAENSPDSRPPDDLDGLGRRLDETRRRRDEPSKLAKRLKSPPGSALGLAFRVAVELVSALAVGLGIGWLLDYWLDTRPWLMIVFIVIGGAAGVLNVYRMASGYGYAVGYEKPDAADTRDNRDEPKDN